jgi:endothelin-converting enzyme/putative endopeptidase
MKSSLAAFSAAALLGLAATQPARCEPPAAPSAAAPERPLTTLPYTPSLEPAFMDRSVDPCVDFYAYTCGKWPAKNPIPADQSRWSVYAKLAKENQQFLWGMLEEASRPDPGRDANTRKIGDYFAACMDTAALDKAGESPLRADLDAIADLKSTAGLAALLGRLQPTAGPGSFFFSFGSGQDYESSTQVIGFASGGGLGLPDRDYYLNDDAKSKEARERYRSYVRQLFQLLADSNPAQSTEAVLRVETALAKASLAPVDRRDPHKLNHRMDRAGLQKLTPSFRWDDYLKAVGQPGLNVFNVSEPELYREIERLIAAGNVNDLKAYLRLHLAAARAEYLSAPFVRADFDFYQSYLQGVKEMPPRWKTCVQLVDRDLGEALGEVFVRKIFPPDTKAATQDMLNRIRAVMERRIHELPWMSEATKQQALAKLHAMRDKIGYPEHWRDYSALEVKRDDFVGNVTRAHSFEMHRELAKIGKPVDRGEWELTPPTVNAYYNTFMNDINFPAGVLLPPLYDPKLDAAPSYGDTGGTIGHELTHGFDDEGRQFDAQGNLKDWWTPQDDAEFRKRVQCVADQYAQYTVVDDIKINSKLTLGEDVADLGGLILAYYAWKDATHGQTLESRDGLTPDQRFFVGFAQWACGDDRPEALRLMARVNPHSPHEARINGVVVNMPEFAAAFSCKPGQPMVKEPEKVCRIW